MVEVTLEKVYYSKLKFTKVNGTVSVTGIFQFTMVNFTLVNIHDYRGKNKDDPSPITSRFTGVPNLGKPLYREKLVYIKTHKMAINRPVDHTGET